MILHTCHVQLPSKLDEQPKFFKETRKKLLQVGFVSVSDELAKHFRKYADFLGFDVSPPLDFGGLADLFSSPEQKALCHLYMEQTPNGVLIEMHLIAQDKADLSKILEACNCLEYMQKVNDGTFQEARIIEQLSDRLQNISPNGKLLADKNIASFLSELYNPEIRSSIVPIVETWGGEGAPLKLIIQRLSTGKSGSKRKDEISKLVTESGLFDSAYLITCNKCEIPTLEFHSETEAKQALQQSTSRKCMVCREGQMQITNAYKVKEAVAKGLQQGLWLEKLVYDTVEPYAAFARQGRMIETFELDVVAVTCARTILMECKDKSFGQNDYVNLSAKADEIDADVIGVVTTQPIHENVKRLIDRRKGEARRNIFVIEDIKDSSQISSHIENEMNKIKQTYIQRLLSATDARPFRRYPSSLARLRPYTRY